MVDVVAAFQDQAKRNPDAIAVDHLGTRTSYDELAKLSQRCAAALLSAVGPQPIVLLALLPSPHAYAAMIGTLMAGGTFCPIDVTGPEKRNAEIVRSLNPDAVLQDAAMPASFVGNERLAAAINVRDLPSQTTAPVCSTTSSQQAAYVVFTSGSTGRPKGVVIARSSFSHFVDIAQNYFRTSLGERWGQYSNLGYDLAIMDVFSALCHGATLVTFASPTDRLFPAQAIARYRVNIWQSVPSVFDLMLGSKNPDDSLKSLRVMSFCGEPLLASHLDTLFHVHPELVVFNTYGTTETTGFNTLNHLTSANYKDACLRPTVALGNDVPGWTIQLVGGPSPDEGQIVVCGDNLSLGYWSDEERTRRAFRHLIVSGHTLRSYFTGDWGERHGQQLYFRGRIDRQVKVKGERIELDEIDFRLREAGFRASASVLADPDIYSFVESEARIDEDSIRRQLAEYLPFHAIPKRVLRIERIPRNQNGKVAFTELCRRVTKAGPDG